MMDFGGGYGGGSFNIGPSQDVQKQYMGGNMMMPPAIRMNPNGPGMQTGGATGGWQNIPGAIQAPNNPRASLMPMPSQRFNPSQPRPGISPNQGISPSQGFMQMIMQRLAQTRAIANDPNRAQTFGSPWARAAMMAGGQQFRRPGLYRPMNPGQRANAPMMGGGAPGTPIGINIGSPMNGTAQNPDPRMRS